VLGVGVTLPAAEATAVLVGAGVLLLAGVWPRKMDRSGWFGVVSMALYLLLPIVFIFAFDLYKPAWLKFLIVVLPPFHILVACGVENLVRLAQHATRNTFHVSRIACRVLRALFLLVFTLAILSSLHNLYFDPTYFRDDYRQIAADVAASASPDTAVILNAPNQWEAFTYYYPDRDVYPAPYHPAPDRVETFLSPLVQRYRRLFVLYWGDGESDPHRRIETWLAAHAYKAGDRWYGRVRLATYGVAPLPEKPAAALGAGFGESVRLSGYALGGDRFARGDILPVTLFWEAQSPVPERYKVTVQLLDGAGRLVAQHDSEPGEGFAPTDTWAPGQVIVDRHGVLLPAGLSPGRYTLVVALYHVAGGERLPVTFNGVPVGNLFSLCFISLDES
jgi:hypothetical protein